MTKDIHRLSKIPAPPPSAITAKYLNLPKWYPKPSLLIVVLIFIDDATFLLLKHQRRHLPLTKNIDVVPVFQEGVLE